MADYKRMPCLDCKFADWMRTKSGRLHPSGEGECTWEFRASVLAAAYQWSSTPKLTGGTIWRHEGLPGDGRCPQFQRGGPDAEG